MSSPVQSSGAIIVIVAVTMDADKHACLAARAVAWSVCACVLRTLPRRPRGIAAAAGPFRRPHAGRCRKNGGIELIDLVGRNPPATRADCARRGRVGIEQRVETSQRSAARARCRPHAVLEQRAKTLRASPRQEAASHADDGYRRTPFSLVRFQPRAQVSDRLQALVSIGRDACSVSRSVMSTLSESSSISSSSSASSASTSDWARVDPTLRPSAAPGRVSVNCQFHFERNVHLFGQVCRQVGHRRIVEHECRRKGSGRRPVSSSIRELDRHQRIHAERLQRLVADQCAKAPDARTCAACSWH